MATTRAAPHETLARNIGTTARKSRKAAGLSRKQLAAMASVSERYLNDLENGTANSSIGILSRLAMALGLDVATLLQRALDAGSIRERLATKSDTGLPQSLHSEPLHPVLSKVLAGMSLAEQLAAAPVLERFVGSRRRASRGIALLGLRGAGKSTLGRLLAQRHELSFVSITGEIESRAGMSLADLFNLGGPDAYRSIENEVARDLASCPDRIVLETAGGIVGNAEAMAILLGAFRTIWLRARPDEHLQRVIDQGDTRPMRGNPRALEHLKSLLAEREPEYRRAEYVLDTSGKSIEACLAELEALAAQIIAGTT